MKIKTANTILYCLRWRETVDFYRNRLGLSVLMEKDWFVEFEISAAARLSVADEARSSIGSAGGRGLTLTFEVEDLDITHQHLSDGGLNPPPVRKHGWGAEIIRIHDPEGNRLEFWTGRSGVL